MTTGERLPMLTLKVKVLGVGSRSMPPLAVVPSSLTWKPKLAVPLLWEATNVSWVSSPTATS